MGRRTLLAGERVEAGSQETRKPVEKYLEGRKAGNTGRQKKLRRHLRDCHVKQRGRRQSISSFSWLPGFLLQSSFLRRKALPARAMRHSIRIRPLKTAFLQVVTVIEHRPTNEK